MDSPDARDVELAALLERFGELRESDPAAGIEVMRHILADAGLHAEAFAMVWPLVEKHPDRALPLRLALDALVGLGMQDCPLYPTLMERLERAR